MTAAILFAVQGAFCSFLLSVFISMSPVNNIIPPGPVRHHGDRIPDLLLDELDVVPAILRQVLIFPDRADITLPPGELLPDGPGLRQKMRHRELGRRDAVDVVCHADRDLVEVAQNVEDCERHVCRALETASVF